jgi:hypothetical protein
MQDQIIIKRKKTGEYNNDFISRADIHVSRSLFFKVEKALNVSTVGDYVSKSHITRLICVPDYSFTHQTVLVVDVHTLDYQLLEFSHKQRYTRWLALLVFR